MDKTVKGGYYISQYQLKTKDGISHRLECFQLEENDWVNKYYNQHNFRLDEIDYLYESDILLHGSKI